MEDSLALSPPGLRPRQRCKKWLKSLIEGIMLVTFSKKGLYLEYLFRKEAQPSGSRGPVDCIPPLNGNSLILFPCGFS